MGSLTFDQSCFINIEKSEEVSYNVLSLLGGSEMIAFFNSFFQYLVLLVVFAAVSAVGAFFTFS